MKKAFVLIVSAFAVTFTGCMKDYNLDDPGNKAVAGYLYTTTTNGESTNQVVRFSRLTDGSLTNETAYSINSKGGSNAAAGGDAHGEYDFAGSVKIIGNYLLNVNAGGNTVSFFFLDRANGNLALMKNYIYGGTRPVSIAATPVRGSSTESWLVVGNQWNNPNVQKDLLKVGRYPSDAFHMKATCTKPAGS